MADDLVNQCIAELQDLVRCRCHPAYTGRGLHDPDCECDSAEAVRVVTDRIEELEAKLAKAAEALVVIDALDPAGLIEGCSQSALRGLVLRMGAIARTTLTELKGEDRG